MSKGGGEKRELAGPFVTIVLSSISVSGSGRTKATALGDRTVESDPFEVVSFRPVSVHHQIRQPSF